MDERIAKAEAQLQRLTESLDQLNTAFEKSMARIAEQGIMTEKRLKNIQDIAMDILRCGAGVQEVAGFVETTSRAAHRTAELMLAVAEHAKASADAGAIDWLAGKGDSDG